MSGIMMDLRGDQGKEGGRSRKNVKGPCYMYSLVVAADEEVRLNFKGKAA